jgi:hypothetical protein
VRFGRCRDRRVPLEKYGEAAFLDFVVRRTSGGRKLMHNDATQLLGQTDKLLKVQPGQRCDQTKRGIVSF